MRSGMLIFVTLATILLYTKYINAFEICPKENCLESQKCELPIKSSIMCQQQNITCCSVVKLEFRTHCHHYGGECMNICARTLQRNVVDCPSDQVCCVLV
ncbi:uncharacterized protein [Anoplolepis gracilipes]|uniref:uncharacterized protein n=1 Tax=Anoplolepis gracilipes TaxID=354296 RepID=UPI003BA00A2F